MQLKTEIQKVADDIPEEVLPDILNYLKLIQHQSHDQLKLSNNLKKILLEDRELFERLGQ